MDAKAFHINFLTGLNLQSAPGLGAVLDLLEASDHPPTHWGTDETATKKWSRAGVLDYAVKEKSAPGIARKSAPQWTLTYGKAAPALWSVSMEWQKLPAGDEAIPFEVGAALAKLLNPVWGFVQPQLLNI